MTRTVRICDARGERRYHAQDFPLIAGGAGAGDIELPGLEPGVRVALLGLADGALYWQDDAPPLDGCTQRPARWLAPGDAWAVGTARLRCELVSDGLLLRIAPAVEGATLPPDLSAEGARAAAPATDTAGDIEAANYRAPRTALVRRARRNPWSLAGSAGLVAFAVIVWFLLTAKAVNVDVEPAADRVSIDGGVGFAVAGHWLLRPGAYTIVAQKTGHVTARVPIDVTHTDNQRFALALEKLPGRLSVRTSAPGAEVSIDGVPVGTAPVGALELAPGAHALAVRAPRYLPQERQITIEGGGVEQSIDVNLAPAWADVSVDSTPAGAELRVDGAVVGQTPINAQIERGQREIELKLGGYKVWRQSLVVEAGVPQKLPAVVLVKADGLIDVRSAPSGAAVTVDGRFRGETPLELELAPGRSYRVGLSKAGYAPVNRTVDPVSGQDTSLVVTLEGMLGVVRVVSEPPDAEVFVDGARQGTAPQTLNLTAVAHRIELRKAGYATHTSTVTPRPGFEQQVAVTLQTEQAAQRAALAAQIATKLGQPLVLVASPGQFQMGASRRETGRRANETLYEVQLQRQFYIGVKEVTNKEFRSYDASHNSGSRDTYSLDGDAQPAVRVGWEDAARYCNWLSTQEGLPPAYTEVNGTLFSATPMTTGYRLPSEAEWTWVARYAGKDPIRFPWGDDMPPPPKSGNFADQSARATVSIVIDGYDDGFTVTAPVGAFAPNTLGLYDLGGNAAEWTHDRYSIEVSSGFEVLTDPLGPATGDMHVIRGSSYLQGEAANLRLTYRDYSNEARDDVGFRLARYAE